MAEPLTVLGSTASVVGVIDVLTRTVLILRDLQTQWKEAELTFLHLTSQLTALNAALIRIQDWMENDSEEAHHLLVMDLESSLDCCNLLITKMNSGLIELKRKSDGTLTTTARAKLVSNDKTMDQASKMLERQTSAINLLLTACNSRTLADQHKILKQSRSRKAFQRVQKDSVSLKAHRDTTSLLTSYTDNLSKQSMVFDFDGELFGTKVYAPMIRNKLKIPIRFRPRRIQYPPKPDARFLRNELMRPDIKILLLGHGESSKSTWLRQLRLITGNGFSELERRHFRVAIFNMLMNGFHNILCFLNEYNIVLEAQKIQLAAELLRDKTEITPDQPFPFKYLRIFQTVLSDSAVQQAMPIAGEYGLYDNFDYFIEKLEDIFLHDYLPTDQDILHARLRTSGISETVIRIHRDEYRVFDVGGVRSERKKWIHVFEDVNVLLFFAPLSGYDQCLVEDRNGIQMHEAQMLFESVSNNTYFERCLKVVVLSKTDLFKEHLKSRSRAFCNHFPDYECDDSNAAAVEDFLVNRFWNLYRPKDIDGIGGRIVFYSADITNTLEFRKFWDWVTWQIQNPSSSRFSRYSGITGEYKD